MGGHDYRFAVQGGTEMRTGLVLSVVMWLMMVALPASAPAGEWWDYFAAQSGGFADPPSVGDSDADIDFEDGTLWVWAEVDGAVGTESYYWARAKMGREFYYNGIDNGTVSIKVGCTLRGFMDIGPMSQAHNVLDLRVEIRDVTGAIDTLVALERFVGYPKEDQDLTDDPGHLEMIDFDTTSLLNGHDYAVALVVETWCGCDVLESGTSQVDYHFNSGAGEVNLELIEYWWEDTFTEYGDQSAVPNVAFCNQWKQSQYDQVDELSFDLHDDANAVTRWHVDITDFPNSDSYHTDVENKNVFVTALNGEILGDNTVMASGKIWEGNSGSHFEIRNQYWHPDTLATQMAQASAQASKILPDYYWDVAGPDTTPGVPDDWKHLFSMKNIEVSGSDTLKVRGLTFLTSGTQRADLTTNDFVTGVPASVPDFDLGPQAVYQEEVSTGATPMVGGFIYFQYDLMDATGDSVLCTAWGGHHITEPATGVSDAAGPTGFSLYQNVPNPCNPTTTIAYDVPEGGGHVTLRVYDVSGRLVNTLVDDEQSFGRKTTVWDGRNHRGESVASGVYFYRLTAPGFDMTRKMVLLR
jgi:hypothetical protein